jgi:8-oxo-dGTP diphosphatase
MRDSIIKICSRFIKQKLVYAGVPVIIQNSKKEILLGKRSKTNPSYSSFWGLPGGMIDYGEKIETTVGREVKEEMGVDIKIIRRSSNIYENIPNSNCKFHSIDIPYYAKIIKGVPKPKDETSEIKWFKPSEIKKMKLAYDHNKILKDEGIVK